MLQKKGQMQAIEGMIIALVGIGVVLAIGFLIMGEVITNETCDPGNANTSACFNGTADTIEAIADIPGWLPIIIITVIGALLIGLVSMFRERR